VDAVKVSRSGYSIHDLDIKTDHATLRVEVKHYASGFARLYAWLTGRDVLIVRCDHSEPLVIMPLTRAIELKLFHRKTDT